MIDNSIEDLFNEINDSKEYREYKSIVAILNNNSEVKGLIEEIKKLQKEAVNLEYNGDNKYKEIDEIIKKKEEELNNNEDYKEYLTKLKTFNNMLLASSSLLEEYINDKVEV